MLAPRFSNSLPREAIFLPHCPIVVSFTSQPFSKVLGVLRRYCWSKAATTAVSCFTFSLRVSLGSSRNANVHTWKMRKHITVLIQPLVNSVGTCNEERVCTSPPRATGCTYIEVQVDLDMGQYSCIRLCKCLHKIVQNLPKYRCIQHWHLLPCDNSDVHPKAFFWVHCPKPLCPKSS